MTTTKQLPHQRGFHEAMIPTRLELGARYKIFRKQQLVIFIQSTLKGFNFLDEDYKCILKQHLYITPKQRLRQKISDTETITSAIFYIPGAWNLIKHQPTTNTNNNMQTPSMLNTS